SSCASAPSTASAAPQPLQKNRASSGFSRPQSDQAITRRVYARAARAPSPPASAQAPDGVAPVRERADERLRVLLAACLERQLGLGLEHADVAALAVVLDREDVRALRRDHADDAGELTGTVRDQERDDEVAAGRGEPVP